MKEKFLLKGLWSLPNSEVEVAGVLTYDSHECIELELFGCFYPDDDISKILVEAKNENVIHGVTSEGKKITLFNCSQYGSFYSSSSFPIIKYRCQYLLIGKHIAHSDEKRKCSIVVSIPELSYWCPPKAISAKHSKDKVTISFNAFNEEGNTIINVAVNEGVNISLCKGVGYKFSSYYLSPLIEQETYLRITPQIDISLEYIVKLINSFESFLSLATLRKIQCSQVLLYDVTLRGSNENVQLLYIQEKIEDNDKKIFDFLFDFKDIQTIFPAIITKWYNENEDILPVREHLVESIKKKRYFTSVDFLIVIQAIEGFWWRFRDEEYKRKKGISRNNTTKLKVILNELISEFSCIDTIKKINIQNDISAIVDSRNYYSHFVRKSDKPKSKEGNELFKLTRIVRTLLICCVLYNTGFTYVQINEIFENCTNDRVKLV